MGKRRSLTAVLATWAVLAATGAGGTAWAAGDADNVLDKLEEALKQTGQADAKRTLLAGAAKVSSLRALSLAAAAAKDKEVGKEGLAAAGQIAQTLLAPDQPAYVRRAAFLRWAGCQPADQAAKTLSAALRGRDFVQQSGALSLLRSSKDDQLLTALTGEIASLPADAQAGLIEVLASRGDAGAAALTGLAKHKDKKVAVMAIASLGKLGGPKALAAIKASLAEADATVREAALGALGGWADASPLPALLDVLKNSKHAEDRAAALYGLAAQASARAPDKAAQATLLAALALAAGSDAKSGAFSTDEATIAAAKIAQALAASHPKEVQSALGRLAARKLGRAADSRVRSALLAFTIDPLPNLARGAKASSPDEHDLDGPRPEAHAIDGDMKTYWDETDGHDLYVLRVELPKATDVSAISLSGWAHHSFSPKDFRIVCDGKTVATVTGATYANNRALVAFPRTKCKTLELQITGYYGGSPAVRELGIYDPPRD